MLTLIEEHLPSGQYQWERVARDFNQGVRRDEMRDADALKGKFNRLKNHPKPTGVADCPEEVRRAKQAQRAIETKNAVAEFDDDNLEEGDARQAPSRQLSRSPTPSSPVGEDSDENDADEEVFRPSAGRKRASSLPSPSSVPSGRVPKKRLPDPPVASRLGNLTSQAPTPAEKSGNLASQSARQRFNVDTALSKLTASQENASSSDFGDFAKVMMLQMENDRKQAAEDRAERREKEECRKERREAERREDRQSMLLALAMMFGKSLPTDAKPNM